MYYFALKMAQIAATLLFSNQANGRDTHPCGDKSGKGYAIALKKHLGHTDILFRW
jgi:hypothetical protein